MVYLYVDVRERGGVVYGCPDGGTQGGLEPLVLVRKLTQVMHN